MTLNLSRSLFRDFTEDDYLELLAEQGGRCAICGRTQEEAGHARRLHLDHDHQTQKVRGILCASCNHGLGHFRDDITALANAIAYLAAAASDCEPNAGATATLAKRGPDGTHGERDQETIPVLRKVKRKPRTPRGLPTLYAPEDRTSPLVRLLLGILDAEEAKPKAPKALGESLPKSVPHNDLIWEPHQQNPSLARMLTDVLDELENSQDWTRNPTLSGENGPLASPSPGPETVSAGQTG